MVFYQKNREVSNTVPKLQTCLCPCCTQWLHSNSYTHHPHPYTQGISSENSHFLLPNHGCPGSPLMSSKPSVPLHPSRPPSSPPSHQPLNCDQNVSSSYVSAGLTPPFPFSSCNTTSAIHLAAELLGKKSNKRKYPNLSPLTASKHTPPLFCFLRCNYKIKTTQEEVVGPLLL